MHEHLSNFGEILQNPRVFDIISLTYFSSTLCTLTIPEKVADGVFQKINLWTKVRNPTQSEK